MKNQLIALANLGSTWPLMVVMFLLSIIACSTQTKPGQDLSDPNGGCRAIGIFDSIPGNDRDTFNNQVFSFNNNFKLYFPDHGPATGITPHKLSFDRNKEPHRTSIELTSVDTVTQFMVGFGKPFADSNLLALYLVLVKDESVRRQPSDGFCDALYNYTLGPDSLPVYFIYHLKDSQWHKSDTAIINPWKRNFENMRSHQKVRGYTLNHKILNKPDTYLYAGLLTGANEYLNLFNMQKPLNVDQEIWGSLRGRIESNPFREHTHTLSHTGVKPCPPNCPQ